MSQCRAHILQCTDCSSERSGYILDLSSESPCKGIGSLSERLRLAPEEGRCEIDQGERRSTGKVISQGHTEERWQELKGDQICFLGLLGGKD